MIKLVAPNGESRSLHWTNKDPRSHLDLGILYRKHDGGRPITREEMQQLFHDGYYISCSTSEEVQKVARALYGVAIPKDQLRLMLDTNSSI